MNIKDFKRIEKGGVIYFLRLDKLEQISIRTNWRSEAEWEVWLTFSNSVSYVLIKGFRNKEEAEGFVKNLLEDNEK